MTRTSPTSKGLIVVVKLVCGTHDSTSFTTIHFFHSPASVP